MALKDWKSPRPGSLMALTNRGITSVRAGPTPHAIYNTGLKKVFEIPVYHWLKGFWLMLQLNNLCKSHIAETENLKLR